MVKHAGFFSSRSKGPPDFVKLSLQARPVWILSAGEEQSGRRTPTAKRKLPSHSVPEPPRYSSLGPLHSAPASSDCDRPARPARNAHWSSGANRSESTVPASRRTQHCSFAGSLGLPPPLPRHTSREKVATRPVSHMRRSRCHSCTGRGDFRLIAR